MGETFTVELPQAGLELAMPVWLWLVTLLAAPAYGVGASLMRTHYRCANSGSWTDSPFQGMPPWGFAVLLLFAPAAIVVWLLVRPAVVLGKAVNRFGKWYSGVDEHGNVK